MLTDTHRAAGQLVAVLTLVLGLGLSGCGSGGGASAPPQDGMPPREPTDLLKAFAVTGPMCAGLTAEDVAVLRGGDRLTIKVPEREGVAHREPDPAKVNDAHCTVILSVKAGNDFDRRLSGGAVTGRYAQRPNASGKTMFFAGVAHTARWESPEGSQKTSGAEGSSSDRGGTVRFDREGYSKTYGGGMLELTVEVDASEEGYPIAYRWDGLVAFEIRAAKTE